MKPTLLQLEITGDRAEKAIEDPAFVALVDKGWTADVFWFGNEADEEGRQRQFLFMLMFPPREASAIAVQLEKPVGQILEVGELATGLVDKQMDRLMRHLAVYAVVHGLILIVIAALLAVA